ncbi:Rha family transcriptional regulator [Paraburkholderia caffeinilytica]|uniref:Rha family transcriptional regulator n=1 Tax=Paraburkholderia caffeinilytica TaxID=1761016 RepID=UPI0038B91809
MTVPVLNFRDFIAADGDQLTTTSQQVAAVFGKHHNDLLKRIRALAAELPDDRLGYFAETVEMRANPSGGAAIPSPSYCISRDGFTLLAMGFTGKRALGFKLAYIDAFNAMAAYIKNQREGLQFDYLRKELEYKTRKGKISACAREMRHWQDEKPERLGEMNALLDQMQPSLLSH